MKYLVFAAALLTGTAAVASAQSTPDTTDALSATFRLAAVSGTKLPIVYTGNDAGRVDIVAGTLTLRLDHSYAQRETRKSFPSDDAVRLLHQKSVTNSYSREEGTYEVADTLITFTPYTTTAEDPAQYNGVIRAGAVRFTSDYIVYEYRKQ